MGHAVVDGEKVDNGQLIQFSSPYFEDSFTFAVSHLTSVEYHFWLLSVVGKLLFVLAEKFNGQIVLGRFGVIPGGAVDAGVREVLVCLLG